VKVADDLWVTRQLGNLQIADPTRSTKCVMGHCGWTTDQLESELSRKVWFLAKPKSGTSIAEYALGSFMQPPGPEEIQWVKDTMWSGAIHQLGGEYEDLATFPGAHDVVWEQMEEVWRDQLVQLHQRICESDDQLKTNTED